MNGHPSVYETVTNAIIEELEHGVVPWVRPWKTGVSPLPHNVISQRPYRGINILLLWAAASAKGYASPAWLTFRQAQHIGGSVRKGERGTAIVYASSTKKTEKNEEDVEIKKTIHFLRFYFVFNVEQSVGIPDALYAIPKSTPPDERLEQAETFISRIGATIRHGGDSAYYDPGKDMIVLPARDAFESVEHYCATSLHEHIHYTGHRTRLNRDLSGRFGAEAYAAEELIAELGAAFLAAHLKIKGELRHASYIASWLELLRRDRKAIFTAASAATKAAEYLLVHEEHGAWIGEYEDAEQLQTST